MAEGTDTVQLTLGEEFTVDKTAAFHQEVLALFQQGPGTITLDCQELSYIDAAGLQLLWSLRQALEHQGSSLHFSHLSSEVLKLSEELGMASVFATSGNQEDSHGETGTDH